MELQQSHIQSKRLYTFLLVTGIIFISFNLRPAITSVGPLIGTIRDDVGLASWSAGLLTSLPLIAFAIMSPIVPKIGNRLTNETALLLGLGLLLCGISIRSISTASFIFAGTLLLGVGIAICNVLLPGVLKEKFPQKVGLMTSVYTTAMGIIAATASGVSVPLAKGWGLGWQLALLVWAIPAVIGIPIWIYLSRKNNKNPDVEIQFIRSNDQRIWRSPLAWQVALFMGLQSFLFYVTISWLPEILMDYGVPMVTAGWLLSFTQFIGLPASFFVPMIAERFSTQRGIVFIISLFAMCGYVGLVVGTSYTVMVVSITLIGIALSGNFSLALALLGMRARNARQAAELSGMAQSLGYVLAAIGPIVIGYLFDLTQSWTVPLVTMIVVTCFVLLFGMGAGRDRYVLDGTKNHPE